MAVRNRTLTAEEAEDRERVIKMIRDHMEANGFNMLTLSKAIGKNDAYIQQFFEKGVPKTLSEDVRHALSKVLNLHEMHFRIGTQRSLTKQSPPVNCSQLTEKEAKAFPPGAFTPAMPPAYSEPQAPGEIDVPAFLRRDSAPAYPAARHSVPPAEIKQIGQPLEPVAVPLVSTMPKDVPVLGTAVGGDDAEFEMNGQIIDYVRRPPGIQHAREVFAIFVVGSSMEPRFEEGEMVYVNPKRVPRIGDYVLVELHGKDDGDVGRCLVKRLVKRSPAGLVLEQFNPPRDDLQYSASEIKAVHRIMPWTEVLGI